jgi:spore coat polysaccharide biosynthesis predicted glycosyltransferase SpsG
MRRSVVIRADGGHQIGTGHVTRSLRLADCLRGDGGTVTFVSQSIDGCAELIERRGHGLILLPPISQGSSVQAATAVSALEPDLVLNDVRDTSAAYMEPLRETGACLVNFDDRGEGAALADVLVDANRRPDEAAGAAGPRALFGPEYIVLDESFERAHRLPKGVRERVAEVLVFMGGSDPAGLTLRALEALDQLEPEWHTSVALGYGFARHAEAAELAARCRNVDLLPGPSDLAHRMQEADMALCSGGIAMFELACVGTPAVVWCQVDHEVDNARLFVERGAVRCLGLGDESGPGGVAEALRALADDTAARRAMSEAGKKTVDGRGLSRVVEAVETCEQRS